MSALQTGLLLLLLQLRISLLLLLLLLLLVDHTKLLFLLSQLPGALKVRRDEARGGRKKEVARRLKSPLGRGEEEEKEEEEEEEGEEGELLLLLLPVDHTKLLVSLLLFRLSKLPGALKVSFWCVSTRLDYFYCFYSCESVLLLLLLLLLLLDHTKLLVSVLLFLLSKLQGALKVSWDEARAVRLW